MMVGGEDSEMIDTKDGWDSDQDYGVNEGYDPRDEDDGYQFRSQIGRGYLT